MPRIPKVKKSFYCESCGAEELKHGVIDATGSVFCNKRCFKNSAAYRTPQAIFLAKSKFKSFGKSE